MAKNDFLPFGLNSDANVLNPTEWSVLNARSSGFTTGIAKSKEVNTALRQSSIISSTVAQFIADNSGEDVLDNGDLEALQNNLSAALLNKMSGRLLNVQTFTSSGTYIPSPGTQMIIVEAVGGGGGGGGCVAALSGNHSVSGGGGAGGTAVSMIKKPLMSYPVTIGAGGAGGQGAIGQGGGTGGTSSFGTICTATGGIGGGPGSRGDVSVTYTMVVSGGNAGKGIVGNLSVGSYESSSIAVGGAAGNIGSGGGSSRYGTGGARTGLSATGQTAGNKATGFGAGGSGCAVVGVSTAVDGGNGTGGIVIVWEYA